MMMTTTMTMMMMVVVVVCVSGGGTGKKAHQEMTVRSDVSLSFSVNTVARQFGDKGADAHNVLHHSASKNKTLKF